MARRSVPQPAIAVALMAVALLGLAVAYVLDAASVLHFGTALATLITPCLVAAVVLAYQFPVYIRHNTKVYVFTVPLYLMVALLPPPLAGAAAGLGILTGEVVVRRERGTTIPDMLTQTGRWTILALAASALAHAGRPGGFTTLLALTIAAALLWLGDMLTLPLALCPITGERPWRIISGLLRESGPIEAVQYGLGILGALLATEQSWALALLAIPTVLAYMLFKREVDPNTYQLLESMADAVDLRDPFTGGHSRRVAELTREILETLGMRGQEAALIVTAARLHDIGKVGIADAVLIKPGSLTADEESLIRNYPDEGARLLTRYADFAPGVAMVRHHHERWDGAGYPDGLAGTDIPFGARVIAVADSFDAMTTDRPYRRALSYDRAAAILLEGRGHQWDPVIVDALLQTIRGQLSGPVAPHGLHVVVAPSAETA